MSAMGHSMGGHWFWTASHPKPRDLFGSTSDSEAYTHSALDDRNTVPSGCTSTASMDTAIAVILFIVASKSGASGHCHLRCGSRSRASPWRVVHYPSLIHHRFPGVTRGMRCTALDVGASASHFSSGTSFPARAKRVVHLPSPALTSTIASGGSAFSVRCIS
nr:uncharacterized protein LOC129383387 [Dermacentor andersoni]